MSNVLGLAAAEPTWLPTRFWRAVARLAAQLAIVMLSAHGNAELVAAGMLAAGTAITAHAEARFRVLRGQPSDVAGVLAGALTLATILMWLLSLASGARLH